MSASGSPTGERLRGVVERLAPGFWSDPMRARQRQFLAMGMVAAVIFGALWLMFWVAGGHSKTVVANPPNASAAGDATSVTNIGVMAPGDPVSPEDSWVGNAGRKLAQYENDKEEQGRLNRDAKAFEASTMKRFSELEQRLTANAVAQANTQAPLPAPLPPSDAVGSAASLTANAPPGGGLAASTTRRETPFPPALPPPPSAGVAKATSAGFVGGMPPGLPIGRPMAAGDIAVEPPVVPMTRVSLMSTGGAPATPMLPNVDRDLSGSPAPGSTPGVGVKGSLESFLPVSFTRGTLLGGLDAPTGGQAQSNPHPVLIRLSDVSVLPNLKRANYQECFVIGSGYGDISSERAYIRTGVLSCIRDDGQALEVAIEGNVYGEDGKYGIRGKLVSKQGQILANALLAGVVSGIGQGFANANTTYSTSALGSTSTTSGPQAYRAGVGTGVGKALDRLAQYYIKLAEQTFPVIEIDSSREVDVVITRGVRIDAGSLLTGVPVPSVDQSTASSASYFKVQDEDY